MFDVEGEKGKVQRLRPPIRSRCRSGIVRVLDVVLLSLSPPRLDVFDSFDNFFAFFRRMIRPGIHDHQQIFTGGHFARVSQAIINCIAQALPHNIRAHYVRLALA